MGQVLPPKPESVINTTCERWGLQCQGTRQQTQRMHCQRYLVPAHFSECMQSVFTFHGAKKGYQFQSKFLSGLHEATLSTPTTLKGEFCVRVGARLCM